MVKVDVELLRELQELARLAQSLALRTTTKYGMFCDDCGETDPECGFYPMEIGGPHSISGFICNDCEAKQRKREE